MTDVQAYEKVLNDLKAKRAELDAAIATLEALSPPKPPPQQAVVEEPRPGPWANIPIADAAKALLQQQPDSALSVQEIYSVLASKGVNVANANIVSSVLSRRAKEREDIIRVGRGMWAIASPMARELALQIEEHDEEDGGSPFPVDR